MQLFYIFILAVLVGIWVFFRIGLLHSSALCASAPASPPTAFFVCVRVRRVWVSAAVSCHISSRCFVVYNRGDGYRRRTTDWYRCWWREKAAGGFFSFLSFQVQRQQLLSRAAIIEPLLVVGSRQCVVTYIPPPPP